MGERRGKLSSAKTTKPPTWRRHRNASAKCLHQDESPTNNNNTNNQSSPPPPTPSSSSSSLLPLLQRRRRRFASLSLNLINNARIRHIVSECPISTRVTNHNNNGTMYAQRDYTEDYNFNAPENVSKWETVFMPMIERVLRSLETEGTKYTIDKEGLKYVHNLNIRLLSNLLSSGFSISTSSLMTEIEERVKRVIPLIHGDYVLKRAEEIKTRIVRRRPRSNRFGGGHGLHHHGSSAPNSELEQAAWLRFAKLLQVEVFGHKVDQNVTIYLEALLESITTEVFQVTSRYLKNMNETKITAAEIRTGMFVDPLLMDIFYKDDDEGPPPSASFHNQRSFFDHETEIGEILQHSCSIAPENEKTTYFDAVRQLIREERRFFNDLNLIIRVFRDPLTPVISSADLAAIFGNIDDVYEFCNEFLGALEDAVEVADDDAPAIAACFEEFAEGQEFDVFEKYAQFMNLKNSNEFTEDEGGEMPRFSRANLERMLTLETVRSRLAARGPGMINAFRYVLPRLLLLPIYQCFAYFKAIEKLKTLTESEDEKETYQQAEGLLARLKKSMDNLNLGKKKESYLLRLPGRTSKANMIKKNLDLENLIEGWKIEDHRQSCNEFILQGSIAKLGRNGRQSDRYAFLFDGMLVLCKPKYHASTLQCIYKESYVIRNLEIREQDGHKRNDDNDNDHRNTFSSFAFPTDRGYYDHNQTITSTASSQLGFPPASPGYDNHSLSGYFFPGNNNQAYNSNADSISMTSISTEATLSSVQSTKLEAYRSKAFQISARNKTPIVLVAKTPEEKDMWISHLILLNTRSMLERNLDSRLLEEAKHIPLCLPDPNNYRYSIEDLDSNILFEENKENKDLSSNVPLIKGATLLKLIERLTYHKYGDPGQVRTFLTTYRSFCTSSELLNLLIERFKIPEPDFRRCMQTKRVLASDEFSPTSIHPPSASNTPTLNDSSGLEDSNNNNNNNANLTPTSPRSPTHSITSSITTSLEEFTFDGESEQAQKDYKEMLKRFRKQYAQPVQFRVLNLVRHWIDNHYYDFERDDQLLKTLQEFLRENGRHPCRNMRKLIDHIFKVLERKKHNTFVELTVAKFDEKNPAIEWHITKDEKEFNLFTLHPIEIARQLTLLEFDLFRAVKPSELVGTEGESGVWTKKDKHKTSPNLMKLIRHSDNFSFYLMRCIIDTKNFEERVAVVSRIMEILIALLSFNNFNGVIEVLSALTSASVHRLDHTMATIEKNSKHKKAFEEAQEFPRNHYKHYINKLRSINPPCVPFFGSYLTYILHIEEGNPEFLSPPNTDQQSIYESDILSNESCTVKLINFNKKRKVAEITSEIQQYQNLPYRFNPEPSILHFLKSLDPFEDIEKGEFQKKLLSDYLYNQSLTLEPRESKQPNKFNRQYPDKYLKQPNVRIGHQRHLILDHINTFFGSNSSSSSSSATASNVNHSQSNQQAEHQQQSLRPPSPRTPTASESKDLTYISSDTISLASCSSTSTVVAHSHSPSATLTPPQSASAMSSASSFSSLPQLHHNPQYVPSNIINYNDPVFASVYIGGAHRGSDTTSICALRSPSTTTTTPSPSSVSTYFPFNTPPPLPLKPIWMKTTGTAARSDSPTPRSRSQRDSLVAANMHSQQQSQEAKGNGEERERELPSPTPSFTPPPLPPRKSFRSNSGMGPSTSGLGGMTRSQSNHLPPYQPPLRSTADPPASPAFNHQRGNSEIIFSMINNLPLGSPCIVRRNSNLESSQVSSPRACPSTPVLNGVYAATHSSTSSIHSYNSYSPAPPTPTSPLTPTTPSSVSSAASDTSVPRLPPKPKPLKLSNISFR